MALDYSPIVLDSINQATFPNVELHVKNDNTYTLYKPAETKLTIHNIERLRENGTEFIYINSANSEEVQAHIEKGFDDITSNKALSQFSKNLISSQIIINCINNVFKNPNMASAFRKCRIMMKQISFKFENLNELTSLLAKLEQYFDKYLITHTAQVTILSLYLYEKLFDSNEDNLLDIGVGAMLHDIGMLYISNDIIGKTDVLSESEYHRVKIHPKHGCSLLIDVGIKEQVALDIALSHHERHDGSGYPKGLSGFDIPRHAMLVSICDIYCALTMNRPYRSASTPEEALETLKSERRLFEPGLIEGFFKHMSKNAVPAEFAEEKNSQKIEFKTVDSSMVLDLRKRMRDSADNRNELLKLHSLITDNIKNSFGDERDSLTTLRTELKDLLNSMFAADGPK
jgi:HD-GYP domain-containing protein (c-di-GMP phosphodiesterase class II)